MRRKRCGILSACLIFLCSVLVCQVRGSLPVQGRLLAAAGEPLQQNLPVQVVPGGQSIGVLIHSRGVVVAGYAAVLDDSGKRVNPAADAGLRDGDIILKVDGEEVRSESRVRELVARAGAAGQPVTLEVKRGEEIFFSRLNPVFCKETLRYRLGLIVRDSAAGVGTLTFYEPKTMLYGALGHIITDIGSTQPVELSDGRIVGASVQGILRGRRGQPGEKIGMFQGDKAISGTVIKNTKMGIFGHLERPPENSGFSAPLPVAAVHQIHEGPAEVLTVLQGDKVEKFSIEIIRVNPQARRDGRGLVIKITDPRLLDQAGGIIQGMSGSPIIQDNRLAGAVTHVFVNDPAKGYGVPAEWMLREAEIIPEAGTAGKEQKMAG
ncbi:MAG: SpoIVB peptidase [Peptococcaceae bacterium]|nr:SpoIVB peptidase [Peptococcaceae bacterium]